VNGARDNFVPAAGRLWSIVVRCVDGSSQGAETTFMDTPEESLTDREFEALAAFRFEIRRFLAFSETNARTAGLTVQQHQALLAVRGDPGTSSIGTVAERLLIEHHSASELVKRLEGKGLVLRERDPQDRRRVTLHLTHEAKDILARLSAIHRAEIRRMQPTLSRLLNRLVKRGDRRGESAL
jgi:DNA-binding MarR family transcriptional regulator